MFPGTSDDGSVVFFESEGAPLAKALPQRKAKPLRLGPRKRQPSASPASSTTAKPPRAGSFAGAYDWEGGSSELRRRRSASLPPRPARDRRRRLERLLHRIGGTGQLYLRLNPTKPQSDVVINGEGEERMHPARARLHDPRLRLPEEKRPAAKTAPTPPGRTRPPSSAPAPTAPRPSSPARRCSPTTPTPAPNSPRPQIGRRQDRRHRSRRSEPRLPLRARPRPRRLPRRRIHLLGRSHARARSAAPS